LFFATQIKSRQPAVSCVVAQVEAKLKDVGTNPEKSAEVCLVLAEALNNVVEHAYRYANDGDVDIQISISDHYLTISIRDFGPEFNIPKATRNIPPNTCDFDILPEGGFGWNLIQILTDKISLTRTNNQNHLVLKFGLLV